MDFVNSLKAKSHKEDGFYNSKIYMNYLNLIVKSLSDFFNCYKQVDEQVIDDTEILIPDKSQEKKSYKNLNIETIDKNANDLVDMKLVMDKPVYKRIDHLRYFINQLNINIEDDIPEHTLNKIIKNIKKYCFSQYKTPKNVTLLEIKQILRSCGYRKYYKYSKQIYLKVTDQANFVLTGNEKEELLRRFSKINNIYHKCVPKYRINFFNYSYVIHKILQLMKRHDILYLFPLLKSKEKLRDNDKIWEKICNKLNWIYIPSIFDDTFVDDK